jgi:hypothetical protein
MMLATFVAFPTLVIFKISKSDAILNLKRGTADRNSAIPIREKEMMSTPNRTSSAARLNGRKISSPKARSGSEVERRVATPRADLVVVKIGNQYRKVAVSAKEKAPVVLARVGEVMNRPGTDRTRIFRSASGKTVYAYSIDSKDTSKVVREDASGRKIVGRFSSGRFRALTPARSM